MMVMIALRGSIHGRAGSIHAVETGREGVFLSLLTRQVDHIMLLISHLLRHHLRLRYLLMSRLTLRLLQFFLLFLCSSLRQFLIETFRVTKRVIIANAIAPPILFKCSNLLLVYTSDCMIDVIRSVRVLAASRLQAVTACVRLLQVRLMLIVPARDRVRTLLVNTMHISCTCCRIIRLMRAIVLVWRCL